MNVRINGRNPAYLTYQFTDGQGRRRQGQSPLLPLALEKRWLPGDAILVLYDEADSQRHEADIYDLRADERSAHDPTREKP